MELVFFSLAHYTCSGPTSKQDRIFRHWKGHDSLHCSIQHRCKGRQTDIQTDRWAGRPDIFMEEHIQMCGLENGYVHTDFNKSVKEMFCSVIYI